MGNITTKEIKFIAIYARTSTALQEIQETIEAQLLQDREFALSHGYVIVKEYLDEGWSGDVIVRPALDELRLDAKKKMWDAVLIYDPDRLARRYEFQMIVIGELEERGIETLFVTVPPVKDINDKMMRGMRGLFAEYERAKISERFRIGKLSRVKAGSVLVSEAPYGFTYVVNLGKRGQPDYEVGHYIVNEQEASVVRMIFTWVADEGLTLRAVVRRLDELGIKPRKSKRGVWSTSTLSTLLRNRSYIGEASWGATYAVAPINPLKLEKYRKNKKTSRRKKVDGEWEKIAVPRLIEDDLFLRAGERLKANFSTMGRNKKNDYLLAGKMWCMCGRRRTGEGPQQGKHLYYRCTDRVYSFPLPRTCLEGGINARIADELVWDQLKQVMGNAVTMKQQVERWMNEQKKESKDKTTVDVETTKKEISKLKSQYDRYENLYSLEMMTLEKLKGYKKPIMEKISSLEKELMHTYESQKQGIGTELASHEEIDEFTKIATQTLHGLSFESKKAIIGKTIEKISSTQKDMQVHGFINLNKLHVEYFTSHRHCRSSKRRQVNTL